MLRPLPLLSVLSVVVQPHVQASEFDVSVPMHSKGAVTYYVTAQVEGIASAEFMVDTGSGYVVLSDETLAALKRAGRATYAKSVSGVMANGARQTVAIYRVDTLNIGCCCSVRDVEVAAFPGNTRQILGLSALKKVAPFAVSMEPPRLLLSHCGGEPDALLSQR